LPQQLPYIDVELHKPKDLSRDWGYNINIYSSDTDDKKWRCLLGMEGERPLIAIGLNPSRASKTKSDRTISRIKEYACWHGHDSFIMINLCAQRTPFPSELAQRLDKELYQQNMEAIKATFERFQQLCLLAVWGQNINLRTYLKEALKNIMIFTEAKDAIWLQIGPKMTKSGHPLHPARGHYLPLYEFNIEEYFKANFL
jgi:hypothetical protein